VQWEACDVAGTVTSIHNIRPRYSQGGSICRGKRKQYNTKYSGCMQGRSHGCTVDGDDDDGVGVGRKFIPHRGRVWEENLWNQYALSM